MVETWKNSGSQRRNRNQGIVFILLARLRALSLDPARVFAVVVSLVILGAVVANNLPSAETNANGPLLTPVTIPVTVARGDSLWSLARRYGDPHTYIQDRIDGLARENRLSLNRPLLPGQRIQVRVTNPTVLARLKARTVYALR